MTDFNAPAPHTAWWGQCEHCGVFFGGHRAECLTVPKVTIIWDPPLASATVTTAVPVGWNTR